MDVTERTLLLDQTRHDKLSVFFAIVCVVDVFGVFPVVTLPKAVIDCGIYGALVVILVCLVQVYTANLLGKCWIIAETIELPVENKNRYPYSALAEMTYGTVFSNIVSLLVNVTIFGGGIPNLIVASQNLELLTIMSSINLEISFCYWIIIIGMILCPVLWLGSPKDMKLLCTLSVTIVILVFLLVTGCLIVSSSEQTGGSGNESNLVPERSLWELIFILYGILSFQYDIHPCLLTIQLDMKEKTKINSVILRGFAVSLGMFSVVTIIAALKFGSSTQPSLLDTLQTTIPLHFAAFLVAMQLCLSSAVTNSALFQHMEDCMNIDREFNHRRCILRTTLTLFSILIAESVPRFDLVMSLIGGTLTGPLVFILPPLFYLRMLVKEDVFRKKLALDTFTTEVYNVDDEINTEETSKHEKLRSVLSKRVEIFLCVAIIVFGIFCTVMTTYVNINNAIIFTKFTDPCILNVSATLINL